MNTRLSTIVATTVACLLSGSLAHGAVIHSNLGPGDTFDFTEWTVRGPGAGTEIDVAAPFTVGASNAVLTTAEMALIHYQGTNSQTVRLLSDSGGLPGSVLATTSISGTPNSPTLMTADFTASSITLLAGQTYWLLADGSGNTYVGWRRNLLGEQGTKVRFNNGSWLTFFPSVSGAFRINGTTVPEPTTPVLAGLALLGVLGLARRRK